MGIIIDDNTLVDAETIKEFSELSSYLFDMQVTENTNNILLNLGRAIGLLEEMELQYDYVRDFFTDYFELDLKVMKKKLNDIMVNIKEYKEPIDHTHGKLLHRLLVTMLDTQQDAFYNTEYKIDRLEYNAFYLSTAKQYEKAIPQFESYLELMKDNDFLNIRQWLAHNEYIKCLWHCRKNQDAYNKLLPALKYNIELYDKVNYRLKKTKILANKYMQALVNCRQ